jgi:lipoate-protein ligase A
MAKAPLHIIRDGLTGSASLDTAVSRAMLERVSLGDLPESLHVAQPHRVVAFGKHDALTEGFIDAVSIAVDQGFDPTIRIAGGRAVVFHADIIRFAWTVPSTDPVAEMHDRFTTVAAHVVAVLSGLGVAASVGELDREYCPGAYSVHIEGGGKVMGSGQRLARNAAQVAGMVVVDHADIVNNVLVPIYSTLGLDMDPTLTGAVTDTTDVGVDTVASAMVEEFARGRETLQSEFDDTTMSLARRHQSEHDPRIRS